MRRMLQPKRTLRIYDCLKRISFSQRGGSTIGWRISVGKVAIVAAFCEHWCCCSCSPYTNLLLFEIFPRFNSANEQAILYEPRRDYCQTKNSKQYLSQPGNKASLQRGRRHFRSKRHRSSSVYAKIPHLKPLSKHVPVQIRGV